MSVNTDPELDTQRSGFRYSMRALRHRDFTLFFIGAFISNAGGWLSNLTVPYVVYQATESALWVGLVAVFQFGPQVLMSPLGGVLADRHNRRKMLFVTQTGLAASAFLVWAIVAAGIREPIWIMLAVACTGVFNGLNMPSWQSFINDLVPREDLRSAVALNSFQFQLARAVGPALAGFLLAIVGPSWALLYNALSFAAVLLALALMRAKHAHPRSLNTDPVLRQFIGALRYVRSQPGIAMAMVVAFLVGMFVNPLFQFTVVFAGGVFFVGPIILGFMNASMGVGSVIATPIMAGWGHVLGLSKLTRSAFFLVGFAVIGFGLSPNPAVAAVFLAVVGGCFMILMSSTNTAIHLIVADRLRGRVLSIRLMVYMLSLPIGSTVEGALSDAFGPRATMVGVGVCVFVAAIVVSLLRGNFRFARMDDPHDDRDLT